MSESAVKIFLLHSVPQKNQSFVQEKTRCIFSESRGRTGESAAEIFLLHGRILRARAVFFEKSHRRLPKTRRDFFALAPNFRKITHSGAEKTLLFNRKNRFIRKKHGVFFPKCGAVSELLRRKFFCYTVRGGFFRGSFLKNHAVGGGKLGVFYAGFRRGFCLKSA